MAFGFRIQGYRSGPRAVLLMHNAHCKCWREDQTPPHVDRFNTKSAREGQTTDKHDRLRWIQIWPELWIKWHLYHFGLAIFNFCSSTFYIKIPLGHFRSACCEYQTWHESVIVSVCLQVECKGPLQIAQLANGQDRCLGSRWRCWDPKCTQVVAR